MTRHAARAVLVDGDRIVLIKRIHPARDPDPYWVTVGGGIEAGDEDAEAAMRREVAEEIGGTVGAAQQIYVHTQAEPDGIGYTYFFLAALTHMDPGARTGEEFTRSDRGTYETVAIPFTAEAIGAIRLQPPEVAHYLASNAEGLRQLADHQPTPAGQDGIHA